MDVTCHIISVKETEISAIYPVSKEKCVKEKYMMKRTLNFHLFQSLKIYSVSIFMFHQDKMPVIGSSFTNLFADWSIQKLVSDWSIQKLVSDWSIQKVMSD